ncbi:MAG: NAD(P)/FAD-dependent oxidoreductase [Pseudomonadales bacterium]|jgi:hypothetical protein|nr:NAD(P)/FAD-dependent oxidoreductase [Pseudomonadales bacterium]
MEADYLVVGSGASSMSFVDTMLDESDATFVMIDDRPAPGGHWNDTYPFVRLHQPACTYGVASRPLGSMRVETRGTNRGLLELSSGPEIVRYYHALMREKFLASGRVQFHPMATWNGQNGFVSRLSGARHDVTVRRKIVEGTHLTTRIPMTQPPNFAIAPGVTCEPINHVPRLAADHPHITVLGAGKTGIDCLVWLLEQGYPADAITWVMPRASWFWNRDRLQPAPEFFLTTIGGQADTLEACGVASSVDDLALRMEACGMWLRLDEEEWPTLYHAATVTHADLELLRRVKDVVRLGRVEALEPERMILQQGEVVARPDTLYVNCTASAVEGNVGDRTPTFSEGRIALNMLRVYQPCFSSALIAHLEAGSFDEETRAAMTRPAPMTDTVTDWLSSQAATLRDQAAWSADEDVSAWVRGCRLDNGHHLLQRFDGSDEAQAAALGRMLAATRPAVENLERLAGAVH